jgi:hypothetical protein
MLAPLVIPGKLIFLGIINDWRRLQSCRLGRLMKPFVITGK